MQIYLSLSNKKLFKSYNLLHKHNTNNFGKRFQSANLNQEDNFEKSENENLQENLNSNKRKESIELTEDIIRQIKELHKQGVSYRQLHNTFKIPIKRLYEIIQNKTYKYKKFHKKNSEQIKEIIKLASKNLTPSQIADTLKIKRTAVYYILFKYKIPHVSKQEIVPLTPIANIVETEVKHNKSSDNSKITESDIKKISKLKQQIAELDKLLSNLHKDFYLCHNAAEKEQNIIQAQSIREKKKLLQKELFELEGGLHIDIFEESINLLKNNTGKTYTTNLDITEKEENNNEEETFINNIITVSEETANIENSNANSDRLAKIFYSQSDFHNLPAEMREIIAYFRQTNTKIKEIISQKQTELTSLELQQKALQEIKEDVEKKMIKYSNNEKRKPFHHLINKINKELDKIDKKIIKKATSRLPNVKWLTYDDFQNKIYGDEIVYNTAKRAGYTEEERIQDLQRLQKAFTQNCVLFIDTCQCINNNDNYEVKGKFYENTGKNNTGNFSTKKTFIINFSSDTKNLYKNLISSLISNKDKIINA